MKRFLRVIIIILIIASSSKSLAAENEISRDLLEEQKNEYGISEFLDESKKYTDELDISNIFENGMAGKFDNNKILNVITKIFGDNLKNSLLTISGIIIIIIVNSLLKAISENLGNDSVSKIAYYIQYILIVTLLMKNFSDVITSVKTAVQNMTDFLKILIPLLSSLIIATGNITTSGVIEPILLGAITFISIFITDVLIPLILVSTSLGIISKLSSYVRVERLSKFLSKSSVWILTTVLGIFIGLASLEGGLTSNVDNITKKASKSVISASVPVVGSILGDAIDTIIGYSNMIKNATGIVGIFIILSICLKPIINLVTMIITYFLGAALCEPIADGKVVELIEEMGRTFGENE